MFMTEEELSVQVAQIDCIQVDDVDLAKPGQDEVFQQLTADPTSADEQDTRLVGRRKCQQDFARVHR